MGQPNPQKGRGLHLADSAFARSGMLIIASRNKTAWSDASLGCSLRWADAGCSRPSCAVLSNFIKEALFI